MRTRIYFLLIVLFLFASFVSFAAVVRTTSYARANVSTTLEIEWTADNYGSIRWQRYNSRSGSWTDISGATSPVYEFVPTSDELLRAVITTQENCNPVIIEKEIKLLSFTINVVSADNNSVQFEVANADLKDADIVEYGFAYNLSELSTRHYTNMHRVKTADGRPEGVIVCSDLEPGSTYSVRLYMKTSDGSLLFSPVRMVSTQRGLIWSAENWTITKTSLSAFFELKGFSSGGASSIVCKAGPTPESLQEISYDDYGSYRYKTDIVNGLQPSTSYYFQVEASINGQLQTIGKYVSTLPDYSATTVDSGTKPVGHTIVWDATKTFHPISPVGLQTEYPRIIRVGGDTLLCSYHGGSGNDYWVNIYLQRSFDNGRTWSEPALLMDKERSSMGLRYWRFANPEMIQLKNGDILMSFIANGNPESNFNCHVMTMRSKDRGETWGDPKIMGRGRTWEPKVVQLPGGELEMLVASEAAWWQSGGTVHQEILCSRSTDNGVTWTEFVRASYSPNRRDGMPVPLVMQGNKGVLFAIEIVNDGGWGSPSLVHRTLNSEWDPAPWNNADTGKRWHVNLNAHGGAPYIIQLPTGEIVLMAHVNGRTVWQTSYPRVTIGDNNGKNFTSPVTPVNSLPSNQGMYYNSLFLKDNETVWLVVTNSLYDGTTRKKGEIKYLEGKIVKRNF